MRHNIMAIFLSLLLILLLSACGTHENTQDEDLMELNSLYSQIENIIGDAASDDPANCRVIGIGAKPCGGHWIYKVYSVQDTDTLLLSVMVELHYQKERAFNHKWGICSDCMVVFPPTKLVCENGQCIAGD